jgi:hypothetical protein
MANDDDNKPMSPETFRMTVREMLEKSDARYMLDEVVSWDSHVKIEIFGNSVHYTREREQHYGGCEGRDVIHPNDGYCEPSAGNPSGEGLCIWCGRTLM